MNKEIGLPEAEHKRRIISYYEIAQPFYDLAWSGKTHGLHYGLWTDDNVKSRHDAITNENRVLADLAKIKKGDRVLDAGCGIGGSSIWLAQNRGANVVGLNIVQRQLDIGKELARKKRLSDKVSFQLGNYQEIPFPENYALPVQIRHPH